MLVVLVVLALLLRAIVAPVILVATVVLSFGAALGISALIFDTVLGFDDDRQRRSRCSSSCSSWRSGIDYNIFLMTRVREEAHDHGTRRAALIGAGRDRRRHHVGRARARRRRSRCWPRCR